MGNVAERLPGALIEQARRADVLALAERHTQLRRKTASGEYHGPCPHCGGDKRFVVHENERWWFCRDCHERRGDAIELVRWLSPGLSFVDAVQQLTGGSPVPAPAAAPRPAPAAKPKPTEDEQRKLARWLRGVRAEVAAAQDRLLEPEGEPGAEYLLGRGLEPRVWLQYGLGYRPDAAVPGTEGKQRAPAIVLPWYQQGQAVAVRYRFLQAQRVGDEEHKLTSRYRAHDNHKPFEGRLFGGQALPEWALWPEGEGANLHRLCTLLIVEGEINAMSAWQVAGDTRLHVLSIGSESARLSPAMVAYAQRYGQVFVWADKEKIAQQLMAALPGAVGIQSPGGNDANDLHQRGLLGGFLAQMRVRHAKSPEGLEGLLWALYGAAELLPGIDTGTAQVVRSLAGKLGRQTALIEPEAGRWIAEQPGHSMQAPEPPAEMAVGAALHPDRPALPERLWQRALSTYAEARALQLSLRGEYRSALGFDRERGRYYVTAPVGILENVGV